MTKNLAMTSGILLVLAGICGCSTMNQQACQSSDWYVVGYDDGYHGHAAVQFSKHHKACIKHGVTANFQSYQSGHAKGIKEFCKPQRAFQYGSQGKQYLGVCPDTMESGFLHAYQDGKQLYTMRSEIRSVKNEIQSTQRELTGVEEELTATSEHLVSEGLSVLERGLLLEEILQLKNTQERLEDELHELEHIQSGLERKYARYQESTRDIY